MKKTKILSWLLCLTLGIASCSKEAQEPQVVEKTHEGYNKYVSGRETIAVDLTIGAGNEELRLAQQINDDGLPTSPFMEEKDVLIRFAVRKDGYVTYTNAICKKVAGQNKVNYKGGILLPDLGVETSWTGYEIAGVVLGEANEGTQFVETVDTNTVKSIEQGNLLNAEDNILRSKIPYILDWTPFPLNAEGKQESKLQLSFLPVGNLLRIQFVNQLEQEKTLKSLKIKTNAFALESKFDFSKAGNLRRNPNGYNGISTLVSGEPLEPLSDTYQLVKNYELTSPIHIAPKTRSKVYYLWVMPLLHPEWMLRYQGSPYLTEVVGVDNDGKEYNLSALCSPLQEGSNKLTMSYSTGSTIESAFKGGKIPLWYVAEYDVAPDGKSLVSTHTIPPPTTSFDHGYGIRYDYSAIGRKFGFFKPSELSNINVSGYFIPSAGHLAAIAPYFEVGSIFYHRKNEQLATHLDLNPYNNSAANFFPVGQPVIFSENILFPGETNLTQVSSEYLLVEEGYRKHTLYALRFSECGLKNKLTAYRYRFDNYNIPKDLAERTSQTDCNLEVSSVFLGSSYTGDIKTISTPSFWSRSGVINRKFPMIGSMRDGINEPPMHTYYIGAENTTLNIHVYFLSASLGKDELRIRENNHYPVRLFKNEFKTAQ